MNLKVGLALFMGIILVFILAPLFVIWALNVLFPALAIPYTFETYLATLVLNMFLQSRITVKK